MRIKTVILTTLSSGESEDTKVDLNENEDCAIKFSFDDDTHYSIVMSDEMNKGVIGHHLLDLAHTMLKE